MKKIYELHLACTKDEMRPSMNHVLVNKDYCVATNAHIMAVTKTKTVFSNSFYEGIVSRDRNILINREDWAKMCKASVIGILWEADNMVQITHRNKRPEFFKVEDEKSIGRFPNWKAVVPHLSGKSTSSLIHLGINADLLATLQKALQLENTCLTFYGINKAIGVHDDNSNDRDNRFGIIMPKVLQNV